MRDRKQNSRDYPRSPADSAIPNYILFEVDEYHPRESTTEEHLKTDEFISEDRTDLSLEFTFGDGFDHMGQTGRTLFLSLA